MFHDCDQRDRRPIRIANDRSAIELAKAIAIAELEIDSQYNEARHDAFFAELRQQPVWIHEELARFPDYLLCLTAAQLHGDETETLMDILSAGLADEGSGTGG